MHTGNDLTYDPPIQSTNTNTNTHTHTLATHGLILRLGLTLHFFLRFVPFLAGASSFCFCALLLFLLFLIFLIFPVESWQSWIAQHIP